VIPPTVESLNIVLPMSPKAASDAINARPDIKHLVFNSNSENPGAALAQCPLLWPKTTRLSVTVPGLSELVQHVNFCSSVRRLTVIGVDSGDQA
jgi:hypothetical protein